MSESGSKKSIEEIVTMFVAGQELSNIEVSRLCRNRELVPAELRIKLDALCIDSRVVEDVLAEMYPQAHAIGQ
jgi:hypothetical protein